VRELEDDPTFNAGSGSVPTSSGQIEMDAAIMDGRSLEIGAVAAVRGISNPVAVARLLLKEKTVLLVGEGAQTFAAEQGIASSSPASCSTAEPQCDTVGCVARDVHGNIAVATSTGGLTGQRPGRVGDAPIPGCGFYADNQVGGVAISGTARVSYVYLLLRGSSCRCKGSRQRKVPGLPLPRWIASAAKPGSSRLAGTAVSGLRTTAIISRWRLPRAGWTTRKPVSTGLTLKDTLMTHDAPGPLIVIGGHEDKQGDRLILKEIAQYLNGGKLVIATVASHEPEGYFDAYKAAFSDLGVTNLVELYVNEREETRSDSVRALLLDAQGVFFTGGDQLRSRARSATRRSRTWCGSFISAAA
jgi:hypothetical protein